MNSATASSQADSEWSPDSSDVAKAKSGPPGPHAEESSDALSLPNAIARYEIIRQLGRGGFGFVYLASDPELHRQVAIKVPRWDRPLTPIATERFLKEGTLLAQVEHPSIVSVHDLGTTEDGIPFVVMQYVEGKTLDRLLNSKKFPIERTLKLLMQIAVALREAHKETIVHRDFKPSNVIIDSKGRVHLVDFGMALHDDLTLGDFKHKSPIGTPQFMSPEQIRGENHRIDGRTDIWAFGVTMYLMLSGRAPFRGENKQELTRAICFRNPRPLRQLNDAISPELERICMRCVSKLMDERYQSMADLINELKAASTPEESGTPQGDPELESQEFSAHWSGITKSGLMSGMNQSGDWLRESYQMTGESIMSASSGETIHYIPKGLRAFDENDHGFFLSLLPGPTDRLGLPESIRFWVGRMGRTQQVEKIPVGVIYGPSGCGKSSFVRAGLIPRIADEVIPVYVDCTSPDVPRLIIENLYRALDENPPDGDLADCIRKLRQASEESDQRKIVIVLDQFEQWLENCADYSQDELTRALRQCDSGSIQCLVLVRDDYWMSITSFMRCLEQRVEEGRNAMSLPLFDRRHARNVLRSYGRNVGALPPESTALNRQQKRFARDAIESISQNGTVLCVHLTILADMLADKDWGKTTFNRALGADSIGTAFLERHLNDNARVTKSGWLPCCDVIFSELLPPSATTSLKAHDRKKSELREAADHHRNQSQFSECLNYLSRELKLITEVESDDGSIEPSYRLTHDFFVIPIRLWLNRRRSATLAGRTRSRFDQLSHQYQIGKNKRYLPNPLEYLMTLFFVRRRDLKAEAKQFLNSTHRYYSSRIAAIVVLLTIVGLIGTAAWNSQVAKANYASLFSGDSREVRETIRKMQENAGLFVPRLLADAESSNTEKSIRSHVALTLIDHSNPEYLASLLSLIEHASPDDYEFYEESLAQFSEPGVARDMLQRAYDSNDDLIARCRLARLQLDMNHDTLLKSIFENVATPDGRTEFTDVFDTWHGNIEEFCDWLVTCRSTDVIFGGMEALSFVHPDKQSLSLRQKVTDTIDSLYAHAADPGVSSIIEFCARQWDIPLETRTDRDYFGDPLPGCDVSPSSLIRIHGGPMKRANGNDVAGKDESIEPGQNEAQEVRIATFFVSSTEVTVGMFRKYIERPGTPKEVKERYETKEWWEDTAQLNSAIRELELNDIYEFLNWLSETHNPPLDPAYRPVETDDGKTTYMPVSNSNGFRLPTTDETEWISRAFAENARFSWSSNEYFADLRPNKLESLASRYQSNNFLDSQEQWFEVNSRAPSRMGVYEAFGGADELCHDDRENRQPKMRMYTKSSVIDRPSEVEIGLFLGITSRFGFVPKQLGFRVVRDAIRNNR